MNINVKSESKINIRNLFMLYHTDMVDGMIQLTHTSTQCNGQQGFTAKNLYFPKNKDGQRAEQRKGGMRVNMTEGVKQKERRRTGGDRE